MCAAGGATNVVAIAFVSSAYGDGNANVWFSSMLFIELGIHFRFVVDDDVDDDDDDDDGEDDDGDVVGAVDITMYDSFVSKPFNLFLCCSGNVDGINFLLLFSICA